MDGQKDLSKLGLSIVIPAYNEETRLPPTIDKVLEWADGNSVFEIELIIVDDGSVDGTRDKVRGFAARDPRVHLVEETHVGAMNAIMSGFRQARYDLVANMDADCAVHPREFEKLAPHVNEQTIAQGSRVLRGDLPPVENKGGLRAVFSLVMAYLFRILFPVGVVDPQIGFRMFRKDTVLRVMSFMRLKHDGLKHAEIIVRAYGLGVRVVELPVPYIHDDDSRCVPKSPLRAMVIAVEALWAVLQIWGQCSIDYLRGRMPHPMTRGRLLFWLPAVLGL